MIFSLSSVTSIKVALMISCQMFVKKSTYLCSETGWLADITRQVPHMKPLALFPK